MNIQYKQYWSRMPGRFVNKLTGEEIYGGSFTGSVREWYECFWESIIDIAEHLKITDEEIYVYASEISHLILQTSVTITGFDGDAMLFGWRWKFRLYNDSTLANNKILICNKDKTICGELEILDMVINA
jgi:hypothetical protein